MKNILFKSCLLILTLFHPAINAQQACRPPVPQTSQEPNIFTEEQEVDLGDAIAEQIQRNFHVIDDDEVAGYLRRIGERIVKHLPPTKLRFQFFLVELSEANAFVLPGGRIFVSRKLVAFTQSEDELAAVIAHEIGHLVARQQSITISRRMKETLGVTQVTDRRDIFEKYNLLVENIARRHGAFRRSDNHEGRDQIEAGQIGLFALVAAGYDPQAHARLFDRFAETKGKTGNFFSDLFGVTSPESKRLREMIRGVDALPPGCVETRAGNSQAAEYARWQSVVVSYTGLGRKEVLHAVVSKTVLEPPLRGEITHLRFSHDGKYILAQDDTGINVLTREPFKPLFRIHAPEAEEAQFTPDSLNIVFHTADLRVENWSVAEEKLIAAHEVVIRKTCLQSLLSPDGKILACLDNDAAITLFDVQSKAQIFQRKDFYRINPIQMLFQNWIWIINSDELSFTGLDLINMGFSPDGKYFAAGQRRTTYTGFGLTDKHAVLVYDLQARSPLSLKENVKALIAGGFVFTAPDRMITFYNVEYTGKSALLGLPGGVIIEEFPMFPGKLAPVTKGNYLLVRPFRETAVGVVDLAKRMAIKGNKTPALDIYDQVFIAERLTGELGLYTTDKNQLLKVVTLPRNPLGRLRAMAISPDFNWLAVSERSRGAVWDLTKGERVIYVRGFRGGFFSEEELFYADFPKEGGVERQIASLDPRLIAKADGKEINEDRAVQYGPFLLVTKPSKKGFSYFEDLTFEMRDVRNLTTLWSRSFNNEPPRVWVEPRERTMVLSWPVASKYAQDEIKSDAGLAKRLAAMKEKEGDYFLTVLDANTGETKGKLLIETGKGSFRITNVFAAGDYVVIADSENRMLVYSLATGEQKGRVFGSRAVIGGIGGQSAGLMCVENEHGKLTVYDLVSLEKRDEFTFSHPLSLTSFSRDGKKLFVLTANQSAYVLNMAGTK
ncbi:MAG: M48 family metalloprotease [Acidobacteria bacterium]|nr:M48 family metalloprotease [Acidobacteriota bacterium]